MNKKIIMILFLCVALLQLTGCGKSKSSDDDGESDLTRVIFTLNDEDISDRTVTVNVVSGQGVTINASVQGPEADVGARWGYVLSGYTGSFPRTTTRNLYVEPKSGKIVVRGYPDTVSIVNGRSLISGATTVNIVVE
jgi:hypothetical protein